MTASAIPLAVLPGIAGWRLLSSKKPTDFKAFAADPALKRDLAYLKERLPAAGTPQAILKDPKLKKIVLEAFGLGAQINMDALIRKVLESDPADPTSTAARMVDTRFQAITKALNYGGLSIPEIPALPSETKIAIANLKADSTFNRVRVTFAGITAAGPTGEGISLVSADTLGELAATLQSALRRTDGGREDISVKVSGLNIVMSDARGRGAVTDLKFASSTDATATLVNSTPGRKATPARGGPQNAAQSVIDDIATRYTQAQFEEAIGQTSDTLRRAVYAKRTLPAVTSWYNVIADRPLAEVLQTALGLPASFGRLDVDKQKALLEAKMPLADLRDPAKSAKLLDRYVATASASETSAWASSQSPALTILGGSLGGGAGGFDFSSMAGALLSLR